MEAFLTACAEHSGRREKDLIEILQAFGEVAEERSQPGR